MQMLWVRTFLRPLLSLGGSGPCGEQGGCGDGTGLLERKCVVQWLEGWLPESDLLNLKSRAHRWCSPHSSHASGPCCFAESLPAVSG